MEAVMKAPVNTPTVSPENPDVIRQKKCDSSSVKLVSVYPDAEKLILKIARVSSVNQNSDNVKLIRYLIDNHHWSPFEMVSMCVEIITTRDISRQILRHRSFSFQEFSQRYQDVSIIQKGVHLREPRLQDFKNRQNSFSTDDEEMHDKWAKIQGKVWDNNKALYDEALEMGIAKEQARSLLPEGLTETKLYVNGSIRSWLHYCDLRGSNGTQKEHSEIANKIKEIIIELLPNCAKAMKWI